MPAAKNVLSYQDIAIVPLSDEERETGHLKVETMGIAVSAMHRDGIVVLENAVDIAHADDLNRILAAEAEEMAKLPTTHFNEVRCMTYTLIVDFLTG
jgi:hypothetical protein